MSVIIKIDPEWLIAQVAIYGKTYEQIDAEIDEMIDSALRREGKWMLEEMKRALKPED